MWESSVTSVFCGTVAVWQTGREVKLGMMLFHRYVRLTPAYAATILFYTGVAPHMGKGFAWSNMMNAVTSW